MNSLVNFVCCHARLHAHHRGESCAQGVYAADALNKVHSASADDKAAIAVLTCTSVPANSLTSAPSLHAALIFFSSCTSTSCLSAKKALQSLSQDARRHTL